MWTVENRAGYDRSHLRYPSYPTDEEWALAKVLVPRAKRGGNKRTVDVREVINGLMYVLSTGSRWRAIPKDLPPRSTVNHYFCRWKHDGTLDRLHRALYVLCRQQADRQAKPDSGHHRQQSVKSAEKGGRRINPLGPAEAWRLAQATLAALHPGQNPSRAADRDSADQQWSRRDAKHIVCTTRCDHRLDCRAFVDSG